MTKQRLSSSISSASVLSVQDKGNQKSCMFHITLPLPCPQPTSGYLSIVRESESKREQSAASSLPTVGQIHPVAQPADQKSFCGTGGGGASLMLHLGSSGNTSWVLVPGYLGAESGHSSLQLQKGYLVRVGLDRATFKRRHQGLVPRSRQFGNLGSIPGFCH